MDTYNDGGNSREELSAQKEKFEKQLSGVIDNPLTLENTDTYVDDLVVPSMESLNATTPLLAKSEEQTQLELLSIFVLLHPANKKAYQ